MTIQCERCGRKAADSEKPEWMKFEAAPAVDGLSRAMIFARFGARLPKFTGLWCNDCWISFGEFLRLGVLNGSWDAKTKAQAAKT